MGTMHSTAEAIPMPGYDILLKRFGFDDVYGIIVEDKKTKQQTLVVKDKKLTYSSNLSLFDAWQYVD